MICRPITAELTRDERGAALATVVLISMLIGALAALALNTGEQAQRASARDRNHEIALGVAEAGIHHAVSTIDAHTRGIDEDPCLKGIGCEKPLFPPPGETLDYKVKYQRTARGFEIDSTGYSSGSSLQRARRIRVELLPPPLFPDARYALFSQTSIELKNNNEVLEGDVWANRSVSLSNGSELWGSVTSAESWIRLEENAKVHGDARSGGLHSDGWAIRLRNNAVIGLNDPDDPSVVTVPGDPDDDCVPGGLISNSGTIYAEETCDFPLVPLELPPFTFNPDNYESVDEFVSASEFNHWLESGNEDSLSGTFYINDPAPSAAVPIDLSKVTLVGDTTIVTTAPVWAHNIDENVSDPPSVFVLVSHFEPPDASGCHENQPKGSSDCAIHFKNNFKTADQECRVVSLIYADRGPIALKNQGNTPDEPDMCGSAMGVGLLTKNNQKFQYADEIDRVLGFHEGTFEIARWEELPVED